MSSARTEVPRPRMRFVFDPNGDWRELLGTKAPAAYLAAAIAAGAVVTDDDGVWHLRGGKRRSFR